MTAVTESSGRVSAALRATAASDPDRPAIDIDGRVITYAELDRAADQLAGALLDRLDGDPAHDASARIAVRASGTLEMAIGFLAVQRVGLVSVPVDPDAPPERLRAILSDVEPALLLSAVPGDDALGLPVPVAHPGRLGSGREPEPVDRPRGELVSIVHTSGSTGEPKGIMMGRDQVDRLLTYLTTIRQPGISRRGGILRGTVSQSELYVSTILIEGLTLVAYEVARKGLAPLGAWFTERDVHTTHLVPTLVRLLLPTLPAGHRWSTLRQVILSGETSTWQDIAALRAHLPDDAVIINLFGQTETISTAEFVIPAGMPAGAGNVPAGRPLPGAEVLIVDEDGSELPPGRAGEIIVRGQGHSLALGYWRRPELTAATFLDRPDGTRQVRTGDAGRMRPDGILEHLGRLDHLVKVYGNRVELGEVESALRALTGVAAAAAAPVTDAAGNTRLAACVVPAEGTVIDVHLVRSLLGRRLPGYMVPSTIAITAELPQLPGGKVDRMTVAALAEQPPVVEAGEQQAPIDRLEADLATIWQELLEVERIARHDSFFALGGDSLLATEMFILIEERLGLDHPVSVLAEAPTIASLALRLTVDPGSWDAPVALRTEGSRPPLFIVHDARGGLLFARDLADYLDADQPVYGLRCPLVDGDLSRFASLEDLASSYVERIRDLSTGGAYSLYGTSLGGVIALEMARQLLEAGAEVPLVGLGDTFFPLTEPEDRRLRRVRRSSELTGLQRANFHLRALVWDTGYEAKNEIQARLSRTAAAHPPPEPDPTERVPAAERGQRAFEAMGELARRHRVRAPFPSQVLLLCSMEEQPRTDWVWRRKLGARMRVVDIPGTHLEITKGRFPWVGPALASALDDVSASERG